MNKERKTQLALALAGTRIGAIIACALGVNPDEGPRFTSKAVVTSDGYLQANFVDGDGISRHSAFVGSFGELEQNMIAVSHYLMDEPGVKLTPEEDQELRTAVLSDWIAVDYR